jgi:hypothetical protein
MVDGHGICIGNEYACIVKDYVAGIASWIDWLA